MKYIIKKLKKDDPIFKQGFVISSPKKNLQDHIKHREKKENKKNLFLEPVADQKTSTKEIYQRLVNILIKNGWKIKGAATSVKIRILNIKFLLINYLMIIIL